MKMKLQFIIATFIGLVIYIPAAHGQANLTFSGGGGAAPLVTTLRQSVTYTINNSQCVLNSGPLFVFDETGNPLASLRDVTGTISFSVNGGAAQPITNERSGFSLGSISANDIYVYGNLPNVSSGQIVVLSAGTITTTSNVTAAPPANGSFTTFIVSSQGVRCSTDGVAVPLTAATVSIGGRVTTQSGNGIINVRLSLTDSEGNIRTATTTEGGYYSFSDVEVGATYIITATGKRFTFSQPSQVLNVNDETREINFIANSEKRSRVF